MIADSIIVIGRAFDLRRTHAGDYVIYRHGATASARVATIGHGLRDAYARAVTEFNRREFLARDSAKGGRS